MIGTKEIKARDFAQQSVQEEKVKFKGKDVLERRSVSVGVLNNANALFKQKVKPSLCTKLCG